MVLLCLGSITCADRVLRYCECDTLQPEHLPGLFDRKWQPYIARSQAGSVLSVEKGSADSPIPCISRRPTTRQQQRIAPNAYANLPIISVYRLVLGTCIGPQHWLAHLEVNAVLICCQACMCSVTLLEKGSDI